MAVKTLGPVEVAVRPDGTVLITARIPSMEGDSLQLARYLEVGSTAAARALGEMLMLTADNLDAGMPPGRAVFRVPS